MDFSRLLLEQRRVVLFVVLVEGGSCGAFFARGHGSEHNGVLGCWERCHDGICAAFLISFFFLGPIDGGSVVNAARRSVKFYGGAEFVEYGS